MYYPLLEDFILLRHVSVRSNHRQAIFIYISRKLLFFHQIYDIFPEDDSTEDQSGPGKALNQSKLQ
jgi:hypothetical protein